VRAASYGAPDSPVRHRTLSGAPATSPGRWVLTVGASDNWATGQSGGALDRSCSLSGAPSDAYSDFCAQARTVAFHCSVADDRWRGIAIASLAHRTVRCSTGQSGATPDCLVNYSGVAPRIPKVASSELSFLEHRTLSGGTPDSPVRQTRAAFGLSFALFI
jgi:hypothetical protein